MPSAVVVVLGDVGRSPRMCYHASSLASHGMDVNLVGYGGSTPHPQILNDPKIRIVNFPAPPKVLSDSRVPRVLQLIGKLIFLMATLSFTLFFRTAFRSSVLILQNPPGIPSLLICRIASWIKGATFIVDWHNYTFSMLQQTIPRRCTSSRKLENVKAAIREFVISTARAFEGFFGHRADWNVCVSRAMHDDLYDRWGFRAVTLHDKPPKWNFTSMDVGERHRFLRRLFDSPEFEEFDNELDMLEGFSESTPFSTLRPNGDTAMREDRPLLIVSSTSWTEDEDFGILLDALREYDKSAELRNAAAANTLPRVICVITGKGPQKAMYLGKIARLQMRFVKIVTVWLAAEDYPLMLASSDIGVSLHTSTSGLDLPMKIVDMFGCQLPVLAKSFAAIKEQIADGRNGRLFNTATELRHHIEEFAAGFPNNEALNTLQRRMRAEHQTDWHSEWDAVLWPLIEQTIGQPETERSRWERFQMADGVESNENHNDDGITDKD